jgi:hypothetical protein
VCDDTLSGMCRWTFGLEPVPAGTLLSHRVERLRGPLLVTSTARPVGPQI